MDRTVPNNLATTMKKSNKKNDGYKWNGKYVTITVITVIIVVAILIYLYYIMRLIRYHASVGLFEYISNSHDQKSSFISNKNLSIYPFVTDFTAKDELIISALHKSGSLSEEPNKNKMMINDASLDNTKYDKTIGNQANNVIASTLSPSINVFGVDLRKIKNGDMFFTRIIANESDRMRALSLLNKCKSTFCLPNSKHTVLTKNWQSGNKSILKRLNSYFKPDFIIRSFVGDDLPTHVCIVGNTPSDDEMRTQSIDYLLRNIFIFDFLGSTGKKKPCLLEFLKDMPSTKAYLYYVGMDGFNITNDLCDMSYGFLSTGYTGLKSYLCHSYKDVDQVPLLRSHLDYRMSKITEEEENVTEEKQAYSEYLSRIRFDERFNKKMILKLSGIQKDEDDMEHNGHKTHTSISSRIITCDANSNPHYITLSKRLARKYPMTYFYIKTWKGLLNNSFSCASMMYALFESWGIVVPIVGCLSFKTVYDKSSNEINLEYNIKIPRLMLDEEDILIDTVIDNANITDVYTSHRYINKEDTINNIYDTHGGEEYKDNEEAKNNELKNNDYNSYQPGSSAICEEKSALSRRNRIDKSSVMRLLPPQQIMPSDYLRHDFQWSPNVKLTSISRVLFLFENDYT